MFRVHRLDTPGREAILAALSRELSQQSGVAFAYAFGSFLAAEAFRDIDVAVWMNDEGGRRADLELAVVLSRIAGFPVDVRLANEAPVSFLFHIFRGRLLVATDEKLLVELLERTARAYHDQAPLVRRATRDAFAA